MTFKVGDIVRCIEPGFSGMLKFGCKYTITKTTKSVFIDDFVCVDNINYEYVATRFELFEQLEEPEHYKYL